MNRHSQDVNHSSLYAFQALIEFPIGRLGITITHNHLTNIAYVQNTIPPFTNGDPLTYRVIDQLNAYFKDPTFVFDLPMALDVTPFQQKVLRYLSTLPIGETRTYADIAAALDTSPRPVGNACRDNPIPIIIPCHRVVAMNSLGGYSGETQGKMMTVKQWLLRHERM